MKERITLETIKDEIKQIRKRNPHLKEDEAFVLWFLIAYLLEDEEQARRCLTGGSGDKNIDAIYIDEKAKQVNIIQGKFRQGDNKIEKRNDVIQFTDLCNLPWKRKHEIEAYFKGLDQLVAEKLDESIKKLRNNGYEMRLYYVTTGKVSERVKTEAQQYVLRSNGKSYLEIKDYDKVLLCFKNYINDITPHIPTLQLKIVPDGAIANEGVIRRYDPEKKIESWIFTVSGKDIGEMYLKVGRKLFARNIRGYLGDTDINDAMLQTIKKEPNNFWYYNNGITIVCDEAKREMQSGEDVLIIEGAQVINGQQTTRTLSKEKGSTDTNVLVKVIKVPRNPNDDMEYDQLVNSIVMATNWQNYISPSDLVSNDFIQVYLEKEFRKRGYQYIRKRMSKSEAKREVSNVTLYQIKKDEIAQAVAACLFDPVLLRKGKENLFEDPYYKIIFKSRDISFYLTKYWLMKQVQRAAKGYPERAYAKWLTLNFAWNLISKEFNITIMGKKFRYACEQNAEKVLKPLNQLLINVFRAAIKFYKLNRGTGEAAIDVSTFFKRSKLHNDFKQFWNSRQNNYRLQSQKKLLRFKFALKKIEIED